MINLIYFMNRCSSSWILDRNRSLTSLAVTLLKYWKSIYTECYGICKVGPKVPADKARYFPYALIGVKLRWKLSCPAPTPIWVEHGTIIWPTTCISELDMHGVAVHNSDQERWVISWHDDESVSCQCFLTTSQSLCPHQKLESSK